MTDTEQLAKLIEDKHACLAQLHALAQRQQELIEGGDMKQLLRLLAAKQHFIATLQRLERDLAPYRDEDPEARQWRSAEDRTRCAAQAAACRELLNGIVHMETSNEALMTQRWHAAADRLRQIHAQVRAGGAYRSHTQGRERPHGRQSQAEVLAPGRQRAEENRPPSTTLDLSSDIR